MDGRRWPVLAHRPTLRRRLHHNPPALYTVLVVTVYCLLSRYSTHITQTPYTIHTITLPSACPVPLVVAKATVYSAIIFILRLQKKYIKLQVFTGIYLTAILGNPNSYIQCLNMRFHVAPINRHRLIRSGLSLHPPHLLLSLHNFIQLPILAYAAWETPDNT
ncbi:hypothetical protein BU24DRAFT_90168 [Aaosphaeria arxii CBS 175.79]|uniref:Uncharacterized protein n=1 Tax=Aaosphaeria arxii CBS 175.79 TaxID=1450172 RepID=A0A6A5X8E3_9PLEO|nr:uncharacterized protein BU24DRAFT_90168 [Aaosphaeria arxii CBS 175.79]KAF2009077.1 hypothetical protein BU24DRAFT_90168 [Aaosphaeria arxii CBS 175.79]